jgi:TetR/AcrR family transcriptional repressor of nem operon
MEPAGQDSWISNLTDTDWLVCSGMSDKSQATRARILDAALNVIRSKGYAATSIDELCAASGVTKGGFFHHFKNKEDLAVAAAVHFGEMARGAFATAPYRNLTDPLLRLLGYIDFRIAILRGSLPQFTCLLGTMVQEAYLSHPAIREACSREINAHAADVAKDIALARDYYAPNAPWSAESLALFTQAVIQGSFILAKANGGAEAAADSLRHLKRYIEQLFHVSGNEEDAA